MRDNRTAGVKITCHTDVEYDWTIKHTLQKCPKVDVNAKPTPCMQLVHLYILNAYPWITAVETNLRTQGGDRGTFKCLLYFHLGC